MFRANGVATTGFVIADTDSSIEHENRGSLIGYFATKGAETVTGREDWRIKRIGDPANMMWWPLDPNSPPTRGTVSGSYSYALPARRKPDGKFLPLRIPGVRDEHYDPLDIEEAAPQDYIVLATVAHGDRRKLAFRHGGNPLLIADHRSDNPPTLSSIVHDGKGKQHDDKRKAGLHTAWEVRHYVAPGTGKQTVVGGTDLYSLAWVGDTAADGTGFCRIGFGDRDGMGSHMVSGPFTPSLRKHLLETTKDGDMLSLALSTNSYFRGSGDPFSAPLDFEEKLYPNPADSTFEYKVFLWYDKKRDHPHFHGKREGLWRWFTRIPIGLTPKCTPTKDYGTTDANDNPRRTFSEDSRAFIPNKMMATGVYFQPRVNLTYGRITGPFGKV